MPDQPGISEKAVYDALKGVFLGPNSHMDNEGLRSRIASHASQPKIAVLVNSHGHAALEQTARILMDGDIFSSKKKAKAKFKESNNLTKAEQQPASTFSFFCNDNPKGSKAAGASEQLGQVDKAASALPASESSGAVGSPQSKLQDAGKPDQISTSTRLPYPAQHALLVGIQRELEIACFKFAGGYMPSILGKHGWNCPEAAELDQLAKELGKRHKELPGAQENPSTLSTPKIWKGVEDIRHIAVHREQLNAKDIVAKLLCAEHLLVLLADEERLASMRSLRKQVTEHLIELDLHEKDAKQRVATVHEDIAARILQLRQKEEKAVASIERRRAAFRSRSIEQIASVVSTLQEGPKSECGSKQPLYAVVFIGWLIVSRFARILAIMVVIVANWVFSLCKGLPSDDQPR